MRKKLEARTAQRAAARMSEPFKTTYPCRLTLLNSAINRGDIGRLSDQELPLPTLLSTPAPRPLFLAATVDRLWPYVGPILRVVVRRFGTSKPAR